AVEPEPIRLPIRLGVAQIGETAPPNELINALKRHRNLIADVVELPLAGDPNSNRYYYQKPDVNTGDLIRKQAGTLRKLGQQMGADYILVIGGNIDSHVEARPVQALDLAILPGFIIPSQTIEMTARAGGAFINAKNGRVEFLLTTTSETTNSCPTFYVDQKMEEMAIEQRSTLSKQLAEELAAKILSRR
ncbi:MAG: hypothetical protein PHP93_03290, partial [Kiritimatiellales bacterium]|nr:hypothetical protein [Kiritimatiellales bacterium]